jgi:hypothetical protein
LILPTLALRYGRFQSIQGDDELLDLAGRGAEQSSPAK